MGIDNHLIAYYILMAAIGAAVIVSAMKRNTATNPAQHRHWNKIAIVAWHLGAILFIIYTANHLM